MGDLDTSTRDQQLASAGRRGWRRGLGWVLVGMLALVIWCSRRHLMPVLYDLIVAPLDWLDLQRLRRRTVEQARGLVLELGVGTGRNFGRYRLAERIIAIDPDPGMLVRAQGRAAQERCPVHLVQAVAESLPFRSAAVDTVVGTLVFCTIADPERALAEIWRVLKPGGELRLLEHVRHPSVGVASVQDAITPVWARLFNGCHPNRDTLRLVRASGFRVHEVHSYLGGLVVSIVADKPDCR